jgi:hypothetical protein
MFNVGITGQLEILRNMNKGDAVKIAAVKECMIFEERIFINLLNQLLDRFTENFTNLQVVAYSRNYLLNTKLDDLTVIYRTNVDTNKVSIKVDWHEISFLISEEDLKDQGRQILMEPLRFMERNSFKSALS